MAFDSNFNNGNACEGRYYNAIAAKRMANAAKTKRATWLAQEDHQQLYDWLNQLGEFEGIPILNEYGEQHSQDTHPLCRGMFSGDFGQMLLKLRNSMFDFGGLTDNQALVVRNALARTRVFVGKNAQRKAEAIEADSKSVFIGELKERRDFELYVRHVIEFEGEWGYSYVNLCNDQDGNIIVIKGTKCFEKGSDIVLKGTVVAHEEREGIKQTRINRPKLAA